MILFRFKEISETTPEFPDMGLRKMEMGISNPSI